MSSAERAAGQMICEVNRETVWRNTSCL